MDEKHCATCDCFARIWGIKRHKVKKFFLRWACIPYLFVSIAIFAFHVDKTLHEKSIPSYWFLIVSFTANWIWIIMGVTVPCMETIKLLAEGCAAWLLDMASRFYRCFCFFCRYFYNQRATNESAFYSLQHVVADSPDAPPVIYTNENPPPLPERHGSIVGMKRSPIIYDLPPKFKRHSPSTSNIDYSPTKAQDAAISETSLKADHTGGATGAIPKTGHYSGGTGARPKTIHPSVATGTRSKTGYTDCATGTRSKIGKSDNAERFGSKTSPVSGNLGAKPKIYPTSSKLGAILKTSPMSGNSGTKSKTSLTSANLSTKSKTSPSCDLGTKPRASPTFGSLGTRTKTSPSANNLGLKPEKSPTASSSSATVEVGTADLSSDAKPKVIRCLFPDTKSSLLATSFGKTIDETENIDDSICELDLTHINVPLSLPSSAIDSPSIQDLSRDSVQLNPCSSDTEQLRDKPQASSLQATHINISTSAKQSVSSYIPFIPENRQQSSKIFSLKDPLHSENSEDTDSISESKLSKIDVPILSNTQSSQSIQDSVKVKYIISDDSTRVKISPQRSSSDPPRIRITPQGSTSDPPRVRISPQGSTSEPQRVSISPQGSPSDLSRLRVSPQRSSSCHTREKISPLALPSDVARVRICPENLVSDPSSLKVNPKILNLDSKEARNSSEAPCIQKSKSSYVPFVLDTRQQNICPVISLPDSDQQSTSNIQTTIKSEHHETNLFTSSFGKTIETTENIDDSILQLDASHIHVQIFPQAEQTSSSQPTDSKLTSQAATLSSPRLKTNPLASSPGSPYIKTSPLASSPGSPYLKTSPLASSPGSPHLKTSPLASSPGSPHLKTIPLASSLYLKMSPQGSGSDSSYLKMSPQESATDTSYLKMSPQGSATDTSYLKMSPRGSTCDSSYLKMSPLTPSDSTVRRLSPNASTEEYPVNTTLDEKDEKLCVSNSPVQEQHEVFNIGQRDSGKDVSGLQPISEDQNNRDETRTYTKFSIISQRNKGQVENNSVQVINDGRSSARVSSFSPSSSECHNQNNFQTSKLRRRTRATSEKCEIKKTVSACTTTRSKTF